MAKRGNTPFMSFEGRKTDDRHVRITRDMLTHPSYINLSNSAKVLYLYMKDWASGRNQFEYAQSLSKMIFGSNKTFLSARDELVERGFIIIVRTQVTGRIPNQYKFVSDWHKLSS